MEGALNMSESCFICDKHQGENLTAGVTIYEDEYVYVGHIDNNGKPNYLGHIMIDLKRHVPTLAEMNPEEAKAFGLFMSRVSNALKKPKKPNISMPLLLEIEFHTFICT
jgi:histidine triad (HIT) family protein